MKPPIFLAAAIFAIGATPLLAQDAEAPGSSDYLGAANPQRDNRPVIGLRRKADYLAIQISFVSDSRDAVTRTKEIHSMMLGAMEKAKAAGFEFATGNPVLTPVTKENYQTISLQWAGREDTSKADVLIKAAFSESVADTEKRVFAFVNGLAGNGRGTIQRDGSRQLIIRNPEQYRTAIIKLIAEDAKRNAEIFGADYRASVDGLDKSVAWSQLNGTDVFLYVPYTYRITAK